LRNEAVVKKSVAKTLYRKVAVVGCVSRAKNTRDFSVVEIREKRDRFVLKFGKLWGA